MAKGKSLTACRATAQTSCRVCSHRQVCLPSGLESDDIEKLDGIIQHALPLRHGESLFRHGDPFTTVYAIQSGSFKTFIWTSNGEEQITGFHLPGELVGLNALANRKHRAGARALEVSSVCRIPYKKLEKLAGHMPRLQQKLPRIMSREILATRNMLILLGKKSAEKRLAIFLLHVSDRLEARGYVSNDFKLSISRTDMANYLGLSMETVSRLFSRFQGLGLLSVECKHVRIHDLAALERLAYSVSNYHSATQQS